MDVKTYRRNIILIGLLTSSPSYAETPRVHLATGAAHAIGGSQSREFGVGGAGAVTIEVPVGSVLGFQGSGGAFVLSSGASPTDPTLASKGVGTAAFGTVGVRIHPLGKSSPSGPWIDANGGLGQTGSLARMMFDAHAGWEFRPGEGRWGVGPFVGYTQVLQPDSALRPDDARIGWVGIAVSLGAPARARSATPAAPPPPSEPPLPPSLPPSEVMTEIENRCPDGEHAVSEGCVADVRLVDDRIVLNDVVHFEFDSPRLRETSYPLVRKIAHFIQKNDDIVEVSIEGHADAVGTEHYNQRLSEARAESVRALLVTFGVDESRLRIVGHGEAHPKVQTTRAEPRNRRVEFVTKRVREIEMSAQVVSSKNKKEGKK